jgi:CTD small phosphatase-like protein 2
MSERKYFCGDCPVILRFSNSASRSLGSTPLFSIGKSKKNFHNSEAQSFLLTSSVHPNFTLEPLKVINSQLRLIKENLRASLSTYFTKFVELPQKPGIKKTLVLDLDETLIHSFESPLGKCENFSFKVRPYLKELLEYASKRFEVVLFTAANKNYADSILKLIDPCKELFNLRLYRENCILTNVGFVKDLRIFKNRQLKDLIIVDNSLISFAFQISNGIPILSWNGDSLDCELLKLIDFLKVLEKADDVRPVIDKFFGLSR